MGQLASRNQPRRSRSCTSNPTPNFQVGSALGGWWALTALSARQVIADPERGLLFKNKRDRKVINVDPRAASGDNSSRHEIKTHGSVPAAAPLPQPHARTRTEYIQCVIYDHSTRRKN